MPYLAMSDGAKIYFEDFGHGETILFCHGLNSSHIKIKNFINEFKDEYRCVCYDQRGHEASSRSDIHMNVKTLGSDINELINYLNLNDVTLIGHSMGAASIFSYVNQFGCERVKRIVAVDMTPYMRNGVWSGGIGCGKWTDENFLEDLDRIFDNVGAANWHIMKNLMNPSMANTPAEFEPAMITVCGAGCDTLTMASLWYSLFRTDQRSAISKITVPFLYVMPETPLYSMTTVNFYKENVKNAFVLEKDFPGTTHLILMEKPHEVAERVKAFIRAY